MYHVNILESMANPAPLIIPALKKHTASIIWAHGLGDTGSGWLPVAENFRQRGKFKDTAFIFPNAPTIPITINMGMKMPGWYDITTFSDLNTAHDEQGILKSREYLHSLIKAEIAKGIPSSRIILGGFSQGGAMSLFAGVTCPDSLAGIFGLSSYLLLHHRIKDFVAPHNPNKDTPIFMGHGSADELVRYEWGRQTAQALRDLGHQVDFRSYPGLQHSADMDEINDLEGWLQERLPPVEPQDVSRGAKVRYQAYDYLLGVTTFAILLLLGFAMWRKTRRQRKRD